MKKSTVFCCIITFILLALFSGQGITQTPEGDKTKNTEKKVEPVVQDKQDKSKIKEETETVPEIESQKLEDPNIDMVVLNTEKGPIKIKLFRKETPITTNNFVDLVKKKFYDGTVFHRVVKGFVIQGGDPLGDGTGNYIDSKTNEPRFITLETHPDLKFDREGRVGMARTNDPNSASCQFFIALAPLPSLNPGGVDPYGYSVFGQITEDTLSTIRKIVEDSIPAFPGSEKPANPIKIHSAVLLSN